MKRNSLTAIERKAIEAFINECKKIYDKDAHDLEFLLFTRLSGNQAKSLRYKIIQYLSGKRPLVKDTGLHATIDIIYQNIATI